MARTVQPGFLEEDEMHSTVSNATRRARGCLAGAAVTLALALAGCSLEVAEPREEGFLWGGSSDGFADPGGAWPVARDWTEADEDAFSEWVETVGRGRAAGRCRVDERAQRISLWSCLATPEVNPLYDARDESTYLYADCGDTPYVLRAYFAYKNALPFSYVAGTTGAAGSLDNGVSYSLDWRDFESFGELARRMAYYHVHAEMFRMPVTVENDDSYPVRIDRDRVRPGAIFYDRRGHVLVVFAVEDDGTVRFVDGHPDNSLTVVSFGEQWPQGSRDTGGGFRAFRPQRFDPATGRFSRARNADLPGYSGEEQFRSSYSVDGRTVGYHEWVRLTLCISGCNDPVGRFREGLASVCGEARARVGSVDAAVRAGMSARPHPDALPPNIYDASGPWMDWEVYSSPGRDVRLRQGFRDLHDFVLESVESARSGERRYWFDGTADDLVATYLELWQAAQRDPTCRVEYRTSTGGAVTLTLADVEERLFDLSFDPYHCPELRWGAAGSELASCPDDAAKLSWYDAEARLRNVVDRGDWATTPLDIGPEEPPDVRVGDLLDSLR